MCIAHLLLYCILLHFVRNYLSGNNMLRDQMLGKWNLMSWTLGAFISEINKSIHVFSEICPTQSKTCTHQTLVSSPTMRQALPSLVKTRWQKLCCEMPCMYTNYFFPKVAPEVAKTYHLYHWLVLDCMTNIKKAWCIYCHTGVSEDSISTCWQSWVSWWYVHVYKIWQRLHTSHV